MATYRGFDVLEIRPDRGEAMRAKSSGLVNLRDNRTEARSQDDRAGFPIRSVSFTFSAANRTDAEAFRSFIESRMGRAIPFWVPTWQADLVLDSSASIGATSLSVKYCGYSVNQYIRTHRRDLSLYKYDGTFQRRRVSGVLAGTTTESLSLDSALSAALAPGSCLVSFLTFCRLASDEAKWKWLSCDVLEAAVEMVEVPWEVPA